MLVLSTEPIELFTQMMYNLGVGLAVAVVIGVVGGLALRFGVGSGGW
jgi:hypothetical protein